MHSRFSASHPLEDAMPLVERHHDDVEGGEVDAEKIEDGGDHITPMIARYTERTRRTSSAQ